MATTWPARTGTLFDGAENPQQPVAFVVGKRFFARGVLSDRLENDEALWLLATGRRLPQQAHGLVVERERQLGHTAVLPY